jgi:hypothetical protein
MGHTGTAHSNQGIGARFDGLDERINNHQLMINDGNAGRVELRQEYVAVVKQAVRNDCNTRQYVQCSNAQSSSSRSGSKISGI